MYNDFKKDDSFQKHIQQSVVIPKWYNKIWGDCDIIESDLHNSKIAKLLDKVRIDKLIFTKNGQMFGLAQRIQRARFAGFKTITLRERRHYNNGDTYDSEYLKMLKSIHANDLKASYRSHCYANSNDQYNTTDLLHGVVVDETLLTEFIITNPSIVHTRSTTDDSGKQIFKYVYYKDIPENIIISKYPLEPKQPKLL